MVFRANHKGVTRDFVVVREVLAVVAAKPELDQLAPTSKYSESAALFPPPQKIIPGVKKSALSGIRWTVPLPWYPLPQNVREILENGENNPRTKRFALKALVSPELSVQTYSKYWSLALHIEEFEMM